jgi:hypothetical protein
MDRGAQRRPHRLHAAPALREPAEAVRTRIRAFLAGQASRNSPTSHRPNLADLDPVACRLPPSLPALAYQEGTRPEQPPTKPAMGKTRRDWAAWQTDHQVGSEQLGLEQQVDPRVGSVRMAKAT